jgi:exopolysaccharide biosynthesis glucuronosyltransferase PssE
VIFLTVGSALPFDRLVRMVDEAVSEGLISEEVFAQIGNGKYIPSSFAHARFLAKSEFEEKMAHASAVISHAGIGTITNALEQSLPLLVLPRLPQHGELVDDHQQKTAQAYAELGHLLVFNSPGELQAAVAQLPVFNPTPRKPNVQGVAQAIGRWLNKQSAAFPDITANESGPLK